MLRVAHPYPPVRSFLTIASNDLETGVFLLDVFDHIDLENGVSLGRVLGQKGSSSHTMIWHSPRNLTLLMLQLTKTTTSTPERASKSSLYLSSS